MEMNLLIFILGLSFLFPFVLFLVGVLRKSFAFSLMGAILMILFSIVFIVVGNLGDPTDNYTVMLNGVQSNISITGGSSVEYVLTNAFGIVSAIFSSFLLLFTVWSQKHRGTGEDDKVQTGD